MTVFVRLASGAEDQCSAYKGCTRVCPYSVVRDGKYVHVTLGSMTEAPTLLPNAHIFVGSKASWEVIADGLPQHEEM